MKKFNLIDILIILLFLLSVYLILTRIFGHSASDLTIMISLFSFFGSILFKLVFVISNLNREIGEFKVKTINSFKKLREDLNDLKDTY